MIAEFIQNKSVLLFDLDGTLVNSVADLHRAMNAALQHIHRPTVSLDAIRQWIGQGAANLCQRVLIAQDGTLDYTHHQQLLTLFLQHYQQQLCVDSSLYDGAKQCLNLAQQQGKRMACITNKSRQAAVVLLQQLDIFGYFELVLGGDSLPQRKPSPEPLLYALQFFNAKTTEAVMIGDSSHDMVAAQGAGVDCIAVSYGYNHGEDIRLSRPLYIIEDLRELFDL